MTPARRVHGSHARLIELVLAVELDRVLGMLAGLLSLSINQVSKINRTDEPR